MSYGNDGTISINFQNSYGTPVTTSNHFIPFIEESVTPEIEDLVSANMSGIFDEGPSYRGKETIGGDIVADINMDTMGTFCRAMFGPATVVTSGSLVTHTFKPVVTDWDQYAANQPFTLLKDFAEGGSAHAYSNLVASKLEFSVGNGEFVKATLSCVGGRRTKTAAVAATYSTDSLWTWDAASASIAGVAVSDLKSLNLVIDDKLETQFVLNNTRYPSHIKRTASRSVEVSGVALFNTQSEFQAFENSLTRPLIVTFLSGLQVQSGFNESIKFDIPSFRYSSYPINLSGPSQIEVSFSGKAKFNTGSDTSLTVTLVSTHTAF